MILSMILTPFLSCVPFVVLALVVSFCKTLLLSHCLQALECTKIFAFDRFVPPFFLFLHHIDRHAEVCDHAVRRESARHQRLARREAHHLELHQDHSLCAHSESHRLQVPGTLHCCPTSFRFICSVLLFHYLLQACTLSPIASCYCHFLLSTLHQLN